MIDQIQTSYNQKVAHIDYVKGIQTYKLLQSTSSEFNELHGCGLLKLIGDERLEVLVWKPGNDKDGNEGEQAADCVREEWAKQESRPEEWLVSPVALELREVLNQEEALYARGAG